MDPDLYRWRFQVAPSCHAALRMAMLAMNVMPWDEGTPDTFVPWDALEDLFLYLSQTVLMYAVVLLLLLLCPSFGPGNPPSYRGYELILSFESGKRRVARFGTYIEDVLTGGQAIPVIRLHSTSFDII